MTEVNVAFIDTLLPSISFRGLPLQRKVINYHLEKIDIKAQEMFGLKSAISQ